MLEHTTSLQESYGLIPQGGSESDFDFRHRVAGELRDKGKLIEAREAQQNARWDSADRGEDVVAGVMGAMAQALNGVDYRVRGEAQVGCDLVAGLYVKHKEPDMTPEEAHLMLALLDRRGGR